MKETIKMKRRVMENIDGIEVVKLQNLGQYYEVYVNLLSNETMTIASRDTLKEAMKYALSKNALKEALAMDDYLDCIIIDRWTGDKIDKTFTEIIFPYSYEQGKFLTSEQFNKENK